MEVCGDLLGSSSRNIRIKINMCKNWNKLVLQHRNFAKLIFVQMEDDVGRLLNFLQTDEVHFSRSGCVSTQYCHMWTIDTHMLSWKEPLHDRKVTFWSGFAASSFIVHLFFQEICGDNFQIISATDERNVALIKNKYLPHLQERQSLYSIVFIQD